MKLKKDGDIAVVHLMGGKANAMDEGFLRGLVKLFDELDASGARAAVLTGYEKFFSAGLALPSLLGLQRAQLRSFMTLFETSMRRVFDCPVPVVAAVNGHAIAGGCVLALQCDMRLMVEGPVKIGLSEVQLGIGLPSSVLETLRFQVPPASLVPIALEGTLFTPEEAKRLGLVDEVVPMTGLMAAAIERARGLARAPAEAMAQIKLGLRRPIAQMMEQRSQQQLEWWLDAWFSPAAQERLTAAVARLSGPR